MRAGVADPPGVIRPAGRLRGTVQLPSDKSIAHRALIANALAGGPATVRLDHPGDDLASTLDCLRALGVSVTMEADDDALLVSLHGEIRQPARSVVLDCGNSGTSMRLLAGALAGRPLTATLNGDASLRRRPMERVAAPLRAMGATVETDGGLPPLRVAGSANLRSMDHHLPVASAQLVSAISLAALSADGETRIESPGPTRDHTERLLAWMGVPIRREGLRTTVRGPSRPRARSLDVPGDPSAAAAWLVAATIHPDAELELIDVALNSTRLGVVDLLRSAGAEIELRPRETDGPEPMGNLVVRSAPQMAPFRIEGAMVAELIDELPLLAIAMASIDGESELRDAGELRVKESDRISATVAGLASIGAQVEELADGWRVRRGSPRDAEIATHGDHRIAIAFAIAALTGVARSVWLDDAGCASVSYPSFWDHLAAVGAG
jgi:3-phosphoshikimate 1-carboxyvinyltransferase